MESKQATAPSRAREPDVVVVGAGFAGLHAPHKLRGPRASSWYMGANIPGKARAFMPYVGGVGTCQRVCDEVTGDGFRLGIAPECGALSA